MSQTNKDQEIPDCAKTHISMNRRELSDKFIKTIFLKNFKGHLLVLALNLQL